MQSPTLRLVRIDSRNRAIRSHGCDADKCEREASGARPSNAFGALRIEADDPNGQTHVDHDAEPFTRQIRSNGHRCKGASRPEQSASDRDQPRCAKERHSRSLTS